MKKNLNKPIFQLFKPLIIIIFFCFLFSSSSFGADIDRFRAPSFQRITPTITPEYETSTIKFVGIGAIRFFSTFISPVDGPRSPSYPTGSAYGREAIQKKGFFTGIILTADRLLHESDVHLGPKIVIHGKTRYYDKVENNTFWWDQAETKAKKLKLKISTFFSGSS